MAQQDNINVNGLSIPVWAMQANAQQIDDTVSAVSAWMEDPDNTGCYYHMVDGVQEWINPPMVLGVEYRTIERYNGRPVYARLNSVTGFGTPGTISEVDIEIGASLLDLVSYSAQLSGWSIPNLLYGGGVGSGLTNAGNVQIEVRAVSTGKIEVYLFSASRNLSSREVNLLIKYTKSE